MRHLKAAVARGAVALVGLIHHDDAGVLGRKRLHDGQRGILAAIVDADDLDVLVRLRQDALKALSQILLHVADGHDHGDERLGTVGHKGLPPWSCSYSFQW